MTDLSKVRTGVQVIDLTTSVALDLIGLPLGAGLRPMMGALTSDSFEKAIHFPIPFTPDAVRTAESALAEHYSFYKPSITSNADIITKQDQEDLQDGILNNSHVSDINDLGLDMSSVKKLEEQKDALLEKRIALTQALRAEGDPVKREGIRKEIQAIDQKDNWLNQGIVELSFFAQNLHVSSLAHTTHRERTRAKFLEGYLNYDEKKVEEARGELFILFRAQDLEATQAGLFPDFIGEYSPHFSYPGLLDYSPANMTEVEARLQEGFKKKYGAEYEGMDYLKKPHPFEVTPTRMYKHVDVPAIIRVHRGYENDDPKTAEAQKRGAWWEMMGDTMVDHAAKVRAATIPNEGPAENHFRRTDVDDNTSYEELLLKTESGFKDLGALQGLLVDVKNKKEAEGISDSNFQRGGARLSNAIPLLVGDGSQKAPPNLKDFIKALDKVEQTKAFFHPETTLPEFHAYLYKADEVRQKELDSLKSQFSEGYYDYYQDLLSTDEGFQKALKAGGPWNVVTLTGDVAGMKVGEDLWKKIEGSEKDLREFRQKRDHILQRLEWVSNLSQLRRSVVQKIQTQSQNLEEAKKEVSDLLKEASVNSDFLAKVDAQIGGVGSVEDLKTVALNLVQEINPLQELKATALELREIEYTQMDSGLEMILSDVEIVAKRDHDKPEGEDAKRIEQFKSGLEAIKNEKDPEKRIALIGEWVQGKDGVQNYVMGVQIDSELAMAEELRGHADDWDDLKDLGLEIVTVGFHDSNDDALSPYDDYIKNLKEAQKAYHNGDLEGAQRLYQANNESPVREYIIQNGQDSAFWYAVTTGAAILVVSTIVTMGASAALTAAVGAGEVAAVVEGTSLVANGIRTVETTEMVVAGARVTTTGERMAALGAEAAGPGFWSTPAARFLVTSSAFWLSQTGLTDLRDGGFFLWDPDKKWTSNLSHIGGSYIENALFFLVFEGIDSMILKPGLRDILAGRATRMAIEAEEKDLSGNVIKSILEASPAVQKKFFDLAYKTLSLGSKAALKVGEGTVEYVGLNAWSAITGDFDWSLKGQITLISFIAAFKGVGPALEKGMERAMKPYFKKLEAKLGKAFERKLKLRIEELTQKNEVLSRRLFDAVGPEGKQILKEYANLTAKAYTSPEGRKLVADIEKIDRQIAEEKKKGGEDSETRLLELQEERRSVEGGLQDLVLNAQQGPEGQGLMAKYRALVDRKLNSPEGSDLWFDSAQLSRDWVSLMESSPELVDFFDKEFPGLRNSQKEAAAQFDWMSRKTFAQEKAFGKGNPFGMRNLHDRYNPAAGVDLIRKLPSMMGENAQHPLYINVDQNGVIEVTPMTVVNGQVTVGDPLRIEPKEKPTYEQVQAMRQEIPSEKRGKIIDTDIAQGAPSGSEAGTPHIVEPTVLAYTEKWASNSFAEGSAPKDSSPLTPADFLKKAKGIVTELRKIDQKIANEKDEGRLAELQEDKRAYEEELDELISRTLQSPAGESLFARYNGYINPNLNVSAGAKGKAEDARLSQQWLQVIESSPELIEFFDNRFPGLREEQREIAGENWGRADSAERPTSGGIKSGNPAMEKTLSLTKHFMTQMKEIGVEYGKINHEMANEKGKARLTKLEIEKKKIEIKYNNILRQFIQTPEGSVLFAHYMDSNPKFRRVSEVKRKEQEDYFLRVWAPVMESNPDIKEFFDSLIGSTIDQIYATALSKSQGIIVEDLTGTDQFLEKKKVQMN